MQKVEVGAAASASFANIGVAWGRAGGVMTAFVILTAGSEALSGLGPDLQWVSSLALIPLIFLTAAVNGALYRTAMEDWHGGDPQFSLGAGGFQWGGVEWRVLGATLLYGLLIGAGILALSIVWVIGLGAAASSDAGALDQLRSADEHDALQALARIMMGPAGWVTLLVLAPGLLFLFYLGLRLSLFPLMAADTRSFNLGQAWALSRGAVLAIVVVSLILFAFELVIGAVAGGVAGLIASETHAGLKVGAHWGGIVGQAINAAISAPLGAGLAIHVYRLKRSDAEVAMTFA